MSVLGEEHADILVVDSSPASRALLGGILERRGYRVRFAHDGEEALAAARAEPPDAILLDLILPGMDGYRLTRRLRREAGLPYIPIIVITAIGDLESKVRGLEAGADDFILKPPDEAELLARVGALLRLKRSQAALLLEKSKTELLYQVSRELSAELDLDTLLSRILHLTSAAVDATHGSVILVNGHSEALRRISWHRGEIVPVAGEVWERVLQEGLAGWVLRYGEGVIVPDTEQDPRWVVVEGAADLQARSVLCVPLQQANRIHGVLTLTHEGVGHFSAGHLELVRSIASQGAIVIEKAWAYQQEHLLARKLQLINDVGRQVTSILHPTQLLQEVARLICQAFDYYHVEIGLLQGRELVFREWGYGREDAVGIAGGRLSLADQGITTWVAVHGEPFLVHDVRQEPRYRFVPELPDTVSELAVPLRVGGEILGVLDIQSDRPGQLTSEDLPLVETLASQVAVALRNAQMYEEQRRRATELSILNEIGRALSAASGLDELVETIHQQVGRLFDTTNFYIAYYEAESDEWVTLLDIEEGQRVPQERYPASAGVTGYIIRHKVPVLLRTAAEGTAFEQQHGIPPLGRPSCSWLGVPLIATDKVVGVMAIQSFEQEYLYGEEDLTLFATIAAQAAVAIERARLYSETERERGKLAAVLAGATDAVVVSDDAGRVLLLNPAAEQSFGVAAEQAVGHPVAEVFTHRALLELFEHNLRGVPPHVAEIPLPDERTLYANISRVPGVGYVAVMQDISALKRLERMKSEFVATVSHDLRAPLATIHGYAELLERVVEAEQRELAQRIRVISEQMAELVGDLLDLGRIEAGVEMARVPCSLECLLRDSVEGMALAAKGRQVDLSLATVPLPAVLGDPAYLRRAIDNLLGNALKYTPAGGWVKVRGGTDQGRVIVEVQDSGIGIPREALPRLFSKFFRVKSPDTEGIPGTGLGLAIVKSIIEMHGGQVWVESELGRGSTFGFALPVDPEDNLKG